ncbi:MAG: hypothetical protein HYR94_23810, partial [Chloroflexi bacterium]|nr:hypothetical protein [Chloroflexota bacterium]
ILSATIDTGQGRHLYPALAVIALFVSLGLIYFGFWISHRGPLALDFGFRIFPFLATHIAPISLRILPAPHHLQFSIFYLLSSSFYLLPAAFSLQPSAFILPHYDTLPITITPPADLPITYRQNLPFADGLSLAGFDAPTSVSAGDALPVTLYWRAEQEAQQDFLVSLCLQNDDNHPVACWRSNFADGRYPARAWESGDTLADTLFIPIPTCYRIFDQAYHLHLEVWPSVPDSPEPMLGKSPVLQQTFAEPHIAIRATDSFITNRPQTLEIWRGSNRLTSATAISLAQALTWLDYATSDHNQAPRFIRQATGASDIWSPVLDFNMPLYLPCDEGPAPFIQFSSFIAGPALLPGPYVPDNSDAPPDLTLFLNLRQRTFAPIRSTLVFTPYLAPLAIEFPDQPSINLNLETWKPGNLADISNSLTSQPFDLPTLQSSNPILPITIRWQSLRWMPDPLIVSLKLLDKDFNVGGERLATLGDRYPNVLWVPTEIIDETYPLRLHADAPPGLYRLEISLLRQDKNLPDGYEYVPLTGGETTLGHNLYPATFRLLDPADGSSPPHPFSAQLGNSIHLTGYDLTPSPVPRPPSPVSLVLYWQSTAKIPTDYTVFTQLLGPDGQVWAQWDNPPQAGRYPTTAWTAQDRVVDRYTLTLRDGAPPGQYRLLVGMYDPATGQRLPIVINGTPQPDNAIELATLTVDY